MMPTNSSNFKKYLLKAIKIVGSQHSLARYCNVKQQSVHKWIMHGIPASRVIQIEKATNGQVTRNQLRPDIYPKE